MRRTSNGRERIRYQVLRLPRSPRVQVGLGHLGESPERFRILRPKYSMANAVRPFELNGRLATIPQADESGCQRHAQFGLELWMIGKFGVHRASDVLHQDAPALFSLRFIG